MPRKYRLEPLLRLKARARRQAEMALARAIGDLEREKKRKEELGEEKQNIIDTKREVRQDLDQVLTSEQGMVSDSYRYTDYLRGLDDDEKQKEREIERQELVIDDAKIVVARARRDYIDAAQEHKVMEKHKDLWEKRRQKEISDREEKELDELGQVIHQMSR